MNIDNYPAEAVALAESRGYDPSAHAAALVEDDIALTHPTNWLTEDEVTHLWDPHFDG